MKLEFEIPESLAAWLQDTARRKGIDVETCCLQLLQQHIVKRDPKVALAARHGLQPSAPKPMPALPDPRLAPADATGIDRLIRENAALRQSLEDLCAATPTPSISCTSGKSRASAYRLKLELAQQPAIPRRGG